jgi:hypothetical protein
MQPGRWSSRELMRGKKEPERAAPIGAALCEPGAQEAVRALQARAHGLDRNAVAAGRSRAEAGPRSSARAPSRGRARRGQRPPGSHRRSVLLAREELLRTRMVVARIARAALLVSAAPSLATPGRRARLRVTWRTTPARSSGGGRSSAARQVSCAASSAACASASSDRARRRTKPRARTGVGERRGCSTWACAVPQGSRRRGIGSPPWDVGFRGPSLRAQGVAYRSDDRP